MADLPTIAITSGEPAGIGPELMSAIASRRFAARLVFIGDENLIRSRADMTGHPITLKPWQANAVDDVDDLRIINIPLLQSSIPGQTSPSNSPYVLELLDTACRGCLQGEFDAMVTAPIQKDIINEAGIPFTGHTEYLAEICQSPRPVMLLASQTMRVALATTHLPLKDVPAAINRDMLSQIIDIIDQDLRAKFALPKPHIKVCGINPHAGENGFLGTEEIDIINPLMIEKQRKGINVSGPYPADTIFTQESLQDADVILAMYHDQGLPVLKHDSFNQAINTTLGLPIIRTSVDHGTALHLAGTGKARPESLFAAIDSAIDQSRSMKQG